MGSNQNGDVHGRLSKILNTLHEISDALSSNSVEDNSRIDSVVSAIESSASELLDLVVGKRDKDTSKDSGNTSFTEVRFVYGAAHDQENNQCITGRLLAGAYYNNYDAD